MISVKKARLGPIVCLALLFSQSASAFDAAAVAAQIPSLFDAGQVSKRLNASPTLPAATASVTHQLKPETPIQSAQKISFKLTKIILSGNTVFTDAQIAAIYQAKLNTTITLSDLQQITEEITKKYREAGYVLSRAILPPQQIKKGVVKIQIIEGYINNVSINGDAGPAKKLLLEYAEKAKRSHPMQIADLEHYMLLANDLPGYKVAAILNPSTTTSGAADLVLNVTRSRVAFMTSYDNYGTRYLGPQQVTASGSVYSLIAGGSMDLFRAVETTRGRDLHYGEYLHTQPIGSNGLNLSVDANYTQTQPGFVLTPLLIVARNATGYMDLSYPVIRSRSTNLYLHSTANYQNVTSTILSSPFYQDRIRSIIVGGAFNHLDHWFGLNTVSLDIEHGFPIWGAHTHTLQSNPFGRTVFTKENLTLARLQQINARFSLLGSVHGQYSNEPLLATEQFIYGGTDYGRGYDPSAIVGDRGAAGKLELRADTSPELRFLQAVQYYAFYDAGIIWNINETNLPLRQTAMSTGVGARINFMNHLSGNVYVAKPLTLPVAVFQILGRNANAPRTFFQLVVSA